MKIINIKKTNILDVVKVLNEGGLVIMPTETVYGAFVDATNKTAVAKLNKYKKRPFGKPYSVAVHSEKMAEKYAKLNGTAKKLYDTFLPGPLTVVSNGKHCLAPGIESENGSLGIRIPDYKFVLDVIKEINRPLTATSANASYQKRPYTIDDILENVSKKQKGLIDLVLDAGKLPPNEPSTVIDTTLDDPVVLRQGDFVLKGKNSVTSRSIEDTMNLAKNLWQKYESHHGKRAIIFALEGKMGSGKTIFTKGLARAMGIADDVVSPTYDLEIDYVSQNKKNLLIHIDLWRMSDINETEDFNLTDKITDRSIMAIEWAEKITEKIRLYSEEAIIIWVKINYGKDENERIISWGII